MKERRLNRGEGRVVKGGGWGREGGGGGGDRGVEGGGEKGRCKDTCLRNRKGDKFAWN